MGLLQYCTCSQSQFIPAYTLLLDVLKRWSAGVKSWCGITGRWRIYLSTSSCSHAPSQPRSVTPGLGEVGGKPLWGNVGVRVGGRCRLSETGIMVISRGWAISPLWCLVCNMESCAASEVILYGALSFLPAVIIIQMFTKVILYKGNISLLSIPQSPEGSQIGLVLCSVLS